MTALTDLVIGLAAVSWLNLMWRVGLVAARMYQIEEYEDARFLRWGATRAWLLHRAVVAAAAVALASLLAAIPAGGASARLVAAGWLAASLVAALLWGWTPAKKPLVVTARMRRLLVGTGILAMLLAAAAGFLLATDRWVAAGILIVAPLACAPALSQALLVAANYVLKPVEAAVRRHYLRMAAAKMGSVAPLVVAVAGSYGKTSTKHILAALLQPSLETLPTRKSFNTLMGVSRVINEDLLPQHRVFVVEMDAYGPGEIAAISGLVHPRVAVLTSAGPQHLERFGTVSRIADALYEVIAALPASGVAIVHGGEPVVAGLATRAQEEGRTVARYGIDDAPGGAPLEVIASDVHVDGRGARFRWSWPENKLVRDVVIPLLGRHQVLNTTAALAVVAVLGQDIDAAVAAAAALEPVEHRLQPLRTGGPVTVIDDSYNANPIGVHNGLDVLASMDGGGKILVTPGLVELGSVEELENRRYGEHAAAVCSDVIVMEARPAAALLAGLRAGGLDEAHIHLVRSLAEATALIGRLSRPGDVVLFANDLPDTYLPSG
ncbi:MAG TPA: UDP-N-acetylmuramoyl-tripeptide--D-alanyl-D-alanine ligase [Candidatus Acidoferrales bacterium]|nr:UDP-N-acetylmuramoyl-tripeptide--D-alanyl-D-alanine ligase [Candidatus Acidoferrales bacterium]